MKRLPKNYKKRALRICLIREAASRRGARPKSRKRRNAAHKAAKPYEILAPKVILIANQPHQHEVVRFLRKLRRESLQQRRISVNFHRTEAVHSCGTLLMLAEIDRIVRARAGRCELSCTYPQNEKVEKVFQQVGVFDLFGKPHRLQVTEDDVDVFHWMYASGVSVAPNQADSILKGIKSQIPKSFRKVVVGVEEAMDNSVHHGYIATRGDRLSGTTEADARRWWLFAEVLDEWLHVSFCDLGVGIPRSLPRMWSEEAGDIARLALTKGKKDAKMIARAFLVGRTRTEKDHRGKGLKNIAAAAKELGGRLMVHSNSGTVVRNYEGDTETETLSSHKRSIMGTVIQWSIPLSSKQV